MNQWDADQLVALLDEQGRAEVEDLLAAGKSTVHKHVHQIIQRIIDRGLPDATITRDVTPDESVMFGAMLAQPRRSDPGWDATCRRLLATYLAGLGPYTSGN